MTKQTFYKKQGRRYVPVSEYDNELLDSFPKGDHLVSVYPGGSSRKFHIDPAYAPMIAAARVAEDVMCRAMVKASELRPAQTPLTEGQRRAWKKLAKEFGDELCSLRGASTHDIVEAGIRAMQEEADKLMTNPAVRKSYERFLMIVELTKEQK